MECTARDARDGKTRRKAAQRLRQGGLAEAESHIHGTWLRESDGQGDLEQGLRVALQQVRVPGRRARTTNKAAGGPSPTMSPRLLLAALVAWAACLHAHLYVCLLDERTHGSRGGWATLHDLAGLVEQQQEEEEEEVVVVVGGAALQQQADDLMGGSGLAGSHRVDRRPLGALEAPAGPAGLAGPGLGHQLPSSHPAPPHTHTHPRDTIQRPLCSTYVCTCPRPTWPTSAALPTPRTAPRP